MVIVKRANYSDDDDKVIESLSKAFDEYTKTNEFKTNIHVLIGAFTEEEAYEYFVNAHDKEKRSEIVKALPTDKKGCKQILHYLVSDMEDSGVRKALYKELRKLNRIVPTVSTRGIYSTIDKFENDFDNKTVLSVHYPIISFLV